MKEPTEKILASLASQRITKILYSILILRERNERERDCLISLL
jgi:hypothetical protein